MYHWDEKGDQKSKPEFKTKSSTLLFSLGKNPEKQENG